MMQPPEIAPAAPPIPLERRDAPRKGPPFAVTVAFELCDGAFGEFHRLVSANAAVSVDCEPGCLRFDVLIPAAPGPPDLFLYEVYASRAAFEVHLASDHYRAFDERTRALVRTKVVHCYTIGENI